MAKQFVPHLCGDNNIYIPDRECSDCEILERRVEALEDIVSKKVSLSMFTRDGDSVTAEVLGEVLEQEI